MSIGGFDPEILQDFLTESNELLEQLEGDLVELEERASDPELVNQVFRALHTIKGSASFLALTNTVEIAHVAESALNAARNGAVIIDRAMMDLLLDAVDVLKRQLAELSDGQTELTAAPAALVRKLAAIGEGQEAPQPVPATSAAATSTADFSPASHTPEPAAGQEQYVVQPLELPSSKADLLDYFVEDLERTIEQVQGQLNEIAGKSGSTLSCLTECADELVRAVDFFDFDEMKSLASLLLEAAEASLSEDAAVQSLLPSLREVGGLLAEQAAGLRQGQRVIRSSTALADRVRQSLSPDSIARLLQSQQAPSAPCSTDEVAIEREPESPGDEQPGADPRKAAAASNAPEQTIRVEVGRLETLMNLVGELVLQKNRITSIARDLDGCDAIAPDLREAVELSSGTLARITSDIQVAVMRTRMQPLDKLFGKYPRLIRDLAAKTRKQIRLVIEGGETEVDKSVIEALNDPLVHLMRNSADHGLEMPDEREAAGKDRVGVISLRAAHQGSHVQIVIHDDGRGLNREKLAAKAVEKGLATEAEIAGLSDEEVYRFILAAGFSTAAQVSDLSGRGVGMDVVRANIEKLKGTIGIASDLGKGTTITINIPLTIAIMPAMMVGIADEIYAIPLGNIVEIVRPEEKQFNTIVESRVMRLRESVLPVLDGMDVFRVPESKRESSRFAIVISVNGKLFAMLVSSVIGQQEIVIKPLDGIGESGPVSGATVRNDGGVSLIVDVAELARQWMRNKGGGEVVTSALASYTTV